MIGRVPDILERPRVYGTQSRTVVIEMCREDAEVLAGILLQYDAKVGRSKAAAAFGYTAAVWQHVAVDLKRIRAVLGRRGDCQLATIGVPPQPHREAVSR
jgi:hypothetical protein